MTRCLLVVLLAFWCASPAEAAPRQDAGVAAKSFKFKLPVPKPGSLTVAQVSLKTATKPVLKVNNPSELSGGVIVAGVAPQGKGRYIARIVIARVGGKTSAAALQEFSFTATNRNIPGVTNRGVTGAVTASFPNFLVTTSSNPASPLCKPPDASAFGPSVLAGHEFGGFSAGDVLTFGVNGPCGHPTKGISAFFGAVRGSSTGPFSFNAVDVATGDFNGDGIDDIVAVSGTPSSAVSFVGLPDGTFGLPLTLSTRPGPTSIAAADINLDGISDRVITDPHTVTVAPGSFLDDGSGDPRVIATEQGNIMGDAIGNLNNDTWPDLAVANQTGIDVFFGNSSGPFQAGPHLMLPGGDKPVDVIIGDVNNDGVPDIIGLGTDGLGDFALSVSMNRGGGMFSTPVDQQFFTADPSVFTFGRQTMLFSPNPRAVGVVASGGARIFFIIPPGLLTPQQLFPVGEGASGGIVGDVNGDNISDLLILNRINGTVSTFVGVSGGYAPPRSSPVGQNPVALSLLDFNKDGKPDLAVANAGSAGNGDVTVLKGTGAGTFTR